MKKLNIKMNRIKTLLAEKDVKNNDLSKALEVNVNTVSRWCRNDAQPRLETFHEIADFLDCDVKDLILSSEEVKAQIIKNTDEEE